MLDANAVAISSKANLHVFDSAFIFAIDDLERQLEAMLDARVGTIFLPWCFAICSGRL